MSEDDQIVRQATGTSSVKTKVEFINFTGSEHAESSKETRRRIHSHAQAHYRRMSCKKKRLTTIELDTSPLYDVQRRDPIGLPQQSGLGPESATFYAPGPSTLLGAGRTDPFASFDLGNNQRAHRLWDHVYDGSCAKFRLLNAIGFLGLARETMAISQMLSASAWHLVHSLQCEVDRGDDARYSLRATQALQQRLGDPTNSTSDEVIVTVLACAAYANLTQNRELFNLHFSSIQQILRHRAGNSFLDSTSPLRLAHFWIETAGRFRTDASPIFPLPDQLLASRSRLHFPLPTLRVEAASETSDLIESAVLARSFGLIQQLNEIVRDELATGRPLWQDIMFPVYHLAPIMHRLLTIPRASTYDVVSLQRRECFRLACVLYVTNLQVKFDPELGIGMLYGSKLRLTLEKEGVLSSWGNSQSVLIWIMTVAACSECLLPELKSFFLTLLHEKILQNEIEPSENLRRIVNGPTWCKEAFQSEIDTLAIQLNLQI